MIVEIQCLPDPLGTEANRYAHVEAAIEVIRASGLTYEVGALGTTVEGEPDELWPLLRSAHEATIAAGAAGSVSAIKVAESAGTAGQPTIDSLTGPFRQGAGG